MVVFGVSDCGFVCCGFTAYLIVNSVVVLCFFLFCIHLYRFLVRLRFGWWCLVGLVRCWLVFEWWLGVLCYRCFVEWVWCFDLVVGGVCLFMFRLRLVLGD